jgi:hypothetical protein
MGSLRSCDSNFVSIAAAHDIDIRVETCVLVNESQL